MKIDIMTLFPDAIDAMMGQSIMGRAQERGYIRITAHQIRDYTTNKQMQVDDYPYGGGRGAVMQADPLYRCWQHICDEAGERVHTIYMSPCGRVLTQQVARELKAQYDHLILVCGHYEGVDQRFLDELIARSDIVDVVSGYVALQRKGGNLFGLCPFHNEKTPSFSVAPDKQIYHCFGCKKGGGVINFIMEIEGLSFPEAVEFLAKRANIPLPAEDEARSNADRLRRLISILLDNAVKYAAPESPITLTLEKGRKGVVLRQSNRCAEPESIDPAKLFDRFYQADPSRGAGGFGIGLSIARSIAEGHRGTIRAAVSGDTITFTAELK